MKPSAPFSARLRKASRGMPAKVAANAVPLIPLSTYLNWHYGHRTPTLATQESVLKAVKAHAKQHAPRK